GVTGSMIERRRIELGRGIGSPRRLPASRLRLVGGSSVRSVVRGRGAHQGSPSSRKRETPDLLTISYGVSPFFPLDHGTVVCRPWSPDESVHHWHLTNPTFDVITSKFRCKVSDIEEANGEVTGADGWDARCGGRAPLGR